MPDEQQILRRRAEARHVLLNIPEKSRRRTFYTNVLRHRGQAGLDDLKLALKEEREFFRLWCAFHSKTFHYSNLSEYCLNPSGDSPVIPVIPDVPEKPTPKRPPWFNHLPHLAPKGMTNAN